MFTRRPSRWMKNSTLIYRCHSTNVFLNHAQMDPETVQIDFEWARNLEHPHGGFNFCESCLILAKLGSVGAVSEVAFKISPSSVQLVDAMNVEPSVKPRGEADDGNEQRDNRNDKKNDAIEERGQPERRVALPEARAGAVKCLCRWRKRQIVGLLGGKFTEPVKRAGSPVHVAHGFQQQMELFWQWLQLAQRSLIEARE